MMNKLIYVDKNGTIIAINESSSYVPRIDDCVDMVDVDGKQRYYKVLGCHIPERCCDLYSSTIIVVSHDSVYVVIEEEKK